MLEIPAKSCKFAVLNHVIRCDMKGGLMLKRKIYNELERWKEFDNKKALLLKGARQVGKTTIVRRFAKDNYKNFIEINFERTPSAKRAFAGNLDARTILLNLSVMGYGPFEDGNTLVFFDEIQSCPEARTAIKFLVEDTELDFIESGSLLGINYKDVSSFPVGYEYQIDMYPMDFEEFLWACGVGEDVIEVAREAYENVEELPEFLHEEFMAYFRKYLIIGGMPEVVSTFVENDDFGMVSRVQSSILTGYRNDISKYAGKDKALAKRVFDSIPTQLSKANKRFVLSDTEKGASYRKYGDATAWLSDAGVAYFSYKTFALEIPFAFHEKHNIFKLFMHDIGLLSHLSLDGSQFDVMSGELSINEGGLTENYVAAELVKRGRSLNYYDKKSRQELDFVYAENNLITILEVKSGRSYKSHASLSSALSSSKNIGRAIVLSAFNVSRGEDGVIYYPLYMTMFM